MSDSIIVSESELRQDIAVKQNIPIGYIPINFSSVGKLSAPSTLHFRDFFYDEAMKLGMVQEKDTFPTLVGILTEACYEKFDCSKLHENEIEEIILNLFFNFWGKTLERVYIPDEEEIMKLNAKDPNILKPLTEHGKYETVELTIKHIDTTPLSNEFKEPIKIPLNDRHYKFILPRAEHGLLANAYVQKVFAKEIQEFDKIERDLDYNRNLDEMGSKSDRKYIDSVKFEAYSQYAVKRASEFYKIRQAYLIHSIDDKIANTLEEKLALYTEIGTKVWGILDHYLSNLEFGINKHIKVKSPYTKDEVTRRFLFQPLELLPTGQIQGSDGHTILFGE